MESLLDHFATKPIHQAALQRCHEEAMPPRACAASETMRHCNLPFRKSLI